MVRKEDIERILPDQVIKTLAERKLMLVLCFFGLFFIILIIVLAALLGHCSTGGSVWPWSGPPGDCRTAGCLRSAGWLVDNMDTSVSPCENFYQYSCGGWALRHSIPEGRSEMTISQHLEDVIDDKLRVIIEKIPKEKTGTDPMAEAEHKLQLFFRSCVHDYGRMKDGGQTLVNLIKSTLKGWYVLDPTNWNRDWNFHQAIAGVQGDLLVNVLFTPHLAWDSGINGYVLGLYTSGLGLRGLNLYDHPDHSAKQDAYRDYMRTVASMLLDDANVTVSSGEKQNRVEQFVNDAYGMERDLAAMLQRANQNRTLGQRLTSNVAELQRNFSQLNWRDILSRMFENYQVTGDTVIKINSPYFFRQLNELIRNETDLHVRDRIFNNYLVWRIALTYSAELSWEYREASLRYREAMYGAHEWPPTWKVCLDQVYNRLGSLLAYEFIKNHISEARKSDVTRMYTDLRQAVVDRILQLEWIDEQTKRKAFDKLNAASVIVGFSESYYNITLMNQLHASLEIDSNYFTNVLSLNKFQRKMRVQLFLNTRDNTMRHQPLLGGSSSYWVTPYLSRYYNTLMIPAGAMLNPIYNSVRPTVMNYGVLGTMVASELVRTIDETGRYYLPNGTFSDWWSNETSNAYTKTTDCFKKYFDQLETGPFLINGQNYTVTVNGDAQLYRLMDDLGGIRAAYYGYKKWKKATGEIDPIPAGVSLTHDQMFFVSSVQSKCFMRTDELNYQYAMSNYLPEDMEVNSLLSHMPEFAEAFKCPRGSKMRETFQCQTF